MAKGKGWYRYRILYGGSLNGGRYDIEMVIQKTTKNGLLDFSKEEAESMLKQVGKYMANDADYKNLREDF